MKNRDLFLLFAYLMLCTPFSTQAQTANDSVYIVNNQNGHVTYNTIDSENNMAHFHLFGDGFFSINRNAQHQFPPNDNGYVTKTWFLAAYDDNVPDELTIPTDSTGQGTATNPKMRMSTEVDVKSSWAPSPNNQHFFMLAFENQEIDSLVDGCVEFHFHSNHIAVDTSEVLVYNNWVYGMEQSSSSETGCNQKIKWSFEDLAKGEQRVVYLPTYNKLSAGQSIVHVAKYKVNCSGSGGASQSGYSSTMRYPHDPNFIEIEGCMKPHSSDYKLEYRFGFHNDGNDYATNVWVTDILDMGTQRPETAVVHSTKDSCNYYIQDDVILSLDYDNIMLPGLEQSHPYTFSYDETCSSGIISVCSRSELPENICIANSLSIVFDEQEPVGTPAPATICTVDECDKEPKVCGRSAQWVNPSDDFEFSVFPNPFQEKFNIVIEPGHAEPSDIIIDLMDYSGKIIQTIKLPGHTNSIRKTLSTEGLPKGVYLLRVTSDGIYTSKSVIKQ